MTTIQLLHYAALAAGYALALARLTDTARPLWGFLPAKFQPVLPALLVVLPDFASAILHGTSGQDVANATLAAAGAFMVALRGALPAAHFEQLTPAAKNELARARAGNGGDGGPPSAALGLLLAFSFGISQYACTSAQAAAVESVVSKVVIAAVQSGEVLDLVQQKADQVFGVVPNPDLQRKVDKGIADARGAVAAVLAASQGADAVAEKDAQKAAEAFKQAWEDLQPLLSEAGIIKGGRLGVAIDDTALPEPLLLKAK